MIAADSISDWRTRSDALSLGSSLGISARMIAGIIWKVEALPTPLAKNSSMNKPRNMGKCVSGVADP